jgi:FkbM family methyltransferase
MKLRARLRFVIVRIPFLRSLAEGLGFNQPAAWVFKRTVLRSFIDGAIGRQLPWTLRAFAGYCRAYFALFPRSDSVFGGYLLFKISRGLGRVTGMRALVHVKVGRDSVYLKPDDPRCIAVITEVKEGSGTEILKRWLSEGDTFIDVGANHGSFSLVAARYVGSTGRIIAFEPQPILAQAIERSLRASVQCGFEVHAIALGSDEGTIGLFVPTHSSGAAGVFAGHSAVVRHRRLEVPIRRLDSILSKESCGNRVLMKIDVEGSEMACLEGAAAFLKTVRPNVLIEIHPKSMEISGARQATFVALLAELGYQRYVEIDGDSCPHHLKRLDISHRRNVMLLPGTARDFLG